MKKLDPRFNPSTVKTCPTCHGDGSFLPIGDMCSECDGQGFLKRNGKPYTSEDQIQYLKAMVIRLEKELKEAADNEGRYSDARVGLGV